MLSRLNLTKLVFPSEFIPQGITETIEMPNLKATSTLTEDLYLNIGSNCPIKTLNFGNFVINSNQLRQLQRFLQLLQGNQNVFWLKDPFDNFASLLPDFTPYQSFTQGILVYHPNTINRGDLYKLYAIQTARGYKGYLRRVYRVSGQAKLGLTNYVTLPMALEATGLVDLEDSYSIFSIPNTVPRFTHNRGPVFSFTASIATFNFLTPFRIVSDFSITPLNTKTAERVYQISGLSMKEVVLPMHSNIKSGFRAYNNINYTSAVPNSKCAFSPATAISRQENSNYFQSYDDFQFKYDLS